jgi:hypothetical protein
LFFIIPLMSSRTASLSDQCIRVILRRINLMKITENPDSIVLDEIPIDIRIAILNRLRRAVRTIENFLIQSFISPAIKLKSGKRHGIVKTVDYCTNMWFGNQHGMYITICRGITVFIANVFHDTTHGSYYSRSSLYYYEYTKNNLTFIKKYNGTDMDKRSMILRGECLPENPHIVRTKLQEFSLYAYFKYMSYGEKM